MDIEEFYDADNRRRSSEEIEFGRDWSDANGARCEISWIEDTGELYVMSEPVEALVSDGIGDLELPQLPDGLLTVYVLGVVHGRNNVEAVLAGWHDAMKQPGSLTWVRDRLVQAPRTAQSYVIADEAEVVLPSPTSEK